MDNKISSRKKTMGRRKIEIKKIDKRSSLQVTFTKRRIGLFRKASELSVLCGAEIAIIVQSPAGKIFPFSNSSSVESVLDRFNQTGRTNYYTSELERMLVRNKYDETVRKLKGEKKIEKGLIMERSGNNYNYMENAFWWDLPMDQNMELHELEEFTEALEGLRSNVLLHHQVQLEKKIHEKQKIDIIDASSSSSLLAMQYNNHEGNSAEFNSDDSIIQFDHGQELINSDDSMIQFDHGQELINSDDSMIQFDHGLELIDDGSIEGLTAVQMMKLDNIFAGASSSSSTQEQIFEDFYLEDPSIIDLLVHLDTAFGAITSL